MIDFKHGKLFEFNNCFINNPIQLGYINLYQVGELGLENGANIFNHVQVCHEISFIVSGEGIFYTNEMAIPVSQGDIHIISKGKSHRIVSNSPKRLRFIYLGFDFIPSLTDTDFEEISRFYCDSPVLTVRDFGEVRSLLDMLINELYTQQKNCKMVSELIIKQVLICTHRLFSSYKPKSFIPPENKNLIGQTVYQIIKYIDHNIFEIKSVKSIAKNLVYNGSYISHLFKIKTGFTIKDYIRNQKISISIELLKGEKNTITEISEQLNYDSPQAFSKIFKKHTGYSPTEYRQMYLKY